MVNIFFQILELPERPSQPGTMAFIAKQGDHPTPRQTKIKGPKCGQCEERKAAVVSLIIIQ